MKPYTKRPDLFTVNVPRYISLVTGNSDYGRFNCNNMGANSQSWNYRSCWHQTGPLLDFTTLEKCDPIQIAIRQTWKSFAPAATRGYSRYLSGAFSGSPTVTARYP